MFSSSSSFFSPVRTLSREGLCILYSIFSLYFILFLVLYFIIYIDLVSNLRNVHFDIVGKIIDKQNRQNTGSCSPAKNIHSPKYLCTHPDQHQATARQALISTLKKCKIRKRMSHKYVTETPTHAISKRRFRANTEHVTSPFHPRSDLFPLTNIFFSKCSQTKTKTSCWWILH